MKWFRYLIVHPLLALLIALVLVLLAAAVLGLTQVGTVMLVSVTERLVPALEVNGVKGTIANQLEADNLVWEDNGIKVDAQQAVFKPGVDFTLPVQARIKQLSAQRLVIDLPPSKEAAYEPIVVPDLRIPLPIEADLENITVAEMIIRQGETEFVFEDVVLDAYTQSDTLYLENLSGTMTGDLKVVNIEARGQMGLEQPQPLQMRMDVDSNSPVLGTGVLELEASGQLQEYRILLGGNWQYGKYPAYQITASASGTFEEMSLEKLQLAGAGGDANVSGRLVWAPELNWDVKGQATQLQPGEFVEGVTGTLDAAVETSGTLQDELTARLEFSQLQGTFQDYPVKATLDAELQGKDLQLNFLDALVGENRLWAQSREDEGGAERVNWRLYAPELAQLHPEITGALAGKGMLSGKVDGSEFALDIESLSGEVLDYAVKAQGGLALRDQLLSARQLEVEVGENQLVMNGIANEASGIDWSLAAANLAQLHPALAGDLKGRGNAKGQWGGSQFALQVERLSGTVKDYPVDMRGTVRLEGEALTLDQVMLKAGRNEVRLNGKANEGRGVSWEVNAPELATLHPELSGTLQGRGNAKGLLDGSRVALRVDQLTGKVKTYPLEARGFIKLEDQLLSAEKLRVAVGENKLRLDGVANEDQGINWLVDAPDLHSLHPALKGRLRGKGNAKGQLDGSRVALRVDALRGEINDYPVRAQGDIRLQDQLLSAQLFEVQVGENNIRLDGEADNDQGVDWVVAAPDLGIFHEQLTGSRLQGQGNVRGKLDGSKIVVRVANLEGQIKDYPLQAKGEIKLDDQFVSAKQFRLAVGENNIRLNGVANEAQGVDWIIDAPQLQTLHPALAGQLQGRGNATGRLDGSRLAVQIDQLRGRVREYPVDARGTVRWRDGELSARQLRVNVGANALRVDGVADQQTGLNWTLDAQKLVQLHPTLDGQLQGRGRVLGDLEGKQIRLNIAQLNGQLKGYPLNAQGGISLREQKILAAHDLRLNVGANALRVDGVVDERTGLAWQLDAQQLAQLHPALAGQLRGRGNVAGGLGGAPVTLNIAQLNGRVKGYPVNAQGTVSLREQKILAAHDLRLNVGANALRMDGVVDERTGLAWQLDAQQLAQLHPALAGQLKGRGNVAGDLGGGRVRLNIAQLNGRVKGYPVSAQGAVSLREQKTLAAHDLRLNVGANALRVNGVVDERSGLAWQLDAQNLAQLSPQVSGQLRGNGSISGVLDGSRLTVRVNNLQGRVKEYPLQVSGEVSRRDGDLSVRNVLVSAGQNTLKLDGSIAGAAGLTWQLDARNVGRLLPSVTGSARGSGRLTGQPDGSQLKLQIARLSGQIDGRPLSAKGLLQINQQGQQINVDQLQVVAGSNVLNLDGQVSEPLNLSWRVNGRNLAQAWPGLSGALQGEGTVQGSMQFPQLRGHLKGNQLRYQDFSVQALDVNIGRQGASYNVKGTLRNLRQGVNVLNYADLQGQGTPERHAVTLAAVHQDGRLDLNASGSLQGQQWSGTINRLALRDTVAGDWQLTAPVRLGASAQTVTVSTACLANQQSARLCAQGGWTQQGGVTAKGQLQQVPLAMASPFLPNTLRLPGRVNADYEFQQRNGRPYGRVNIQLPDNVIAIRTGNGRSETFQYTNARANLTLNDRTANVDVQLDVRDHGQLRTRGTIVLAPENQQHRLDLRTTVAVPSISWLQRFSPQVTSLQGEIAGDVRIAGVVGQPRVTGALRLQNGALYLPETGSRINDINLTAQANGPEQLLINGTLRAGSGQLTVNGALQLASLPDWSGHLRLQGEDLLLMNSHEIQAKVSPDLNIKATPQSAVITGRLYIPETTVSLRELPTGASVRSDDIVIVGADNRPLKGSQAVLAEDSGKPLFIQPNVVIELGKQVKFNGFGLDARMQGKMRVLRNRQGIVAEGALSVVDGVYKAYGQDLRIERGRLLFSGPVDNPGLDVRAVREIPGDITVGISLGGTVQTPESTLFSTPPMSQTDTLSYLLTGRALSRVSGSESEILTQAITGLGVAGGESFAQKLGGQLGLDDVGLNANNGDYKQSELSLGKRLGPKLYVQYIVGLFDSLQKIAVTYQINDKLELEATSGVNQSIDLIYKIDTDRGPFGSGQ